MAKTKTPLPRSKPSVNVGTIGHVDFGNKGKISPLMRIALQSLNRKY